jgi:hypothetical protein
MLVTHRGEGGGHPQSWRTRACGGPHITYASLLHPYAHPHAHPYHHGTGGNTMDRKGPLNPCFPCTAAHCDTRWTADRRAHNPKVAGSNPAPATIEPLLKRGFSLSLVGLFFVAAHRLPTKPESRAQSLHCFLLLAG